LISANSKLGVLLKILGIILVSGILTFFISILAGVDFRKDKEIVTSLDRILLEISAELSGGINTRIMRLGKAPAVKPYKEFYCTNLAKELLDIYYIAEKAKIILGTHDVIDYQKKSTRILGYSKESDLTKLIDEILPLTRELQVTVGLINATKNKLAWKRTAYIILYFGILIGLYIVVFYRYRIIFYFKDRRTGIDRRFGTDRRKYADLLYNGPERRDGKDRRSRKDRRRSI
jgi:hypothetical protein